ncbi:hypothetical protein [Paraburkholderia sp. DGU8]|uniref:hypothetical protein n=1 Tax=Paraburkholderia sp. DGU8 TaxID=3161997 RepID=UPI0034669FA1
MKVRLLMVVASALLLLAPRTANAMAPDGQPGAGMSAHELMQRDANESAQATTDMSYGEPAGGMDGRAQAALTSYGGVAAGQSQSGGARHGDLCASGAQCRMYFGH